MNPPVDRLVRYQPTVGVRGRTPSYLASVSSTCNQLAICRGVRECRRSAFTRAPWTGSPSILRRCGRVRLAFAVESALTGLDGRAARVAPAPAHH